MSETILYQLLTGLLSESDFCNWIIRTDITDLSLSNTAIYDCSKSEFVSYFLNYLRIQTHRFLNTSSNIASVPKSRLYEDNELKDPQIEQSDQCSANVSKFDVSINSQVESDSLRVNTFNKSKSVIRNSLTAESSYVEEPLSPVPHSSYRAQNSSSSVLSSTPKDSNKSGSSFNTSANKKFHKSGDRITLNFGDYMQTNSFKKKNQFCNKSKVSDVHQNDLVKTSITKKSYNLSGKSPDNILEQDFPALGSDTRNAIPRNQLHTSKPNRNRRIKPTALNFSNVDNDMKNSSINKSLNNTKELFEERNILSINKISGNESLQSVSSNFQSERYMLKNEKDFIKKQFENTKYSKPVYIQPKTNQSDVRPIDSGDLSKVTHVKELNTLINIYSILLNNNLIVNFISEVSFIFSLLNADDYQTQSVLPETNLCISGREDDNVNEIDLFPSIHNCIYFSTKTLQEQRQFLILLDCDTIRVLSENARVQIFNPNLCNFLYDILNQKKNYYSHEENYFFNKNVCFQSDTDNRENFTSDQTFRVFRKQRDIFYDILRNWELNHNKANFSFSVYDSSIATLFNSNGGLIHNKGQMRRQNDLIQNEKLTHANIRTEFGRININYNNVCNMTHLARLFVKQMLASCESEHTDGNQLVLDSLPNVDPNRLSLLSSRFFSNTTMTNDITAFTGVEEFFKNFIVHSENHTFIEHLKLIMCSEILEINGYCMESNSSIFLENAFESQDSGSRRTSTVDEKFQQGLDLTKKVSSLRLLAKFLGFVTDLPYNNNGNKNKTLIVCEVDKLKIQPLLDLKAILTSSNEISYLFMVIQWITMYLSMLNESTLAMDYYKNLIEILFDIYISNVTSKYSNRKSNNQVFFKYCIKTVLGYFFDLPNVSANFYDWRFTKVNNIHTTHRDNTLSENMEQNNIYCDVPQVEEENHLVSDIDSKLPFVPLSIKLIEKMLYHNVPILNSLKSIIKGFEPFNKGRVRHVTPFTHQTSNQEIEDRRIQTQLETNFFNNQPPSVRKTVDFVVDRIFSAVIKQLVAEDIFVMKAIVAEKLSTIKSFINKSDVETQVITICNESLKELFVQCNKSAELICNERIDMAVKCLFPIEMLESVKCMCTKICHRKVKLKYQTWFKDNIADIKLLCKDIEAQVQHILTNTILLKLPKDTPVELHKSQNSNSDNSYCNCDPGPSEVLIDLQDMLCKIINKEYGEDVLSKDVTKICGNIQNCLQNWKVLINNFIKSLSCLTVDIVIGIVCHYPMCINEILPNFLLIWKMDLLSTYTKQEDDKDSMYENGGLRIEEAHGNNIEENINVVQTFEDNFIFKKILSSRNIIMLSNTSNVQESWTALSKLLYSLMAERFLTLDCFGQQALKIMQTEWSYETLQNLSFCIKMTMKQLQNVQPIECCEITLLLEWIAEFCEDIDIA